MDGTMRDAMNAKMEGIQAVVANSHKAQTDGHASDVIDKEILESGSMPAPVEVNRANLGDILRQRVAKLRNYVATRDATITKLQQNQMVFQENEAELRGRYLLIPELENQLKEGRARLAEARQTYFPALIKFYEESIKAFAKDLADNMAEIADLENSYPELKAKLDEERRIIAVHQKFLQRFTKESHREDIRYTAQSTPTPREATIKDADTFLAASIKEASENFLIVSVEKDSPALFVSLFGHYNGLGWNPNYLQIAEGAEICKELDAYQKAIQAVWQIKLQMWADQDAAAGLLLAPADVIQQKKESGNRYNIVNLVREGNGFCFVPIDSNIITELPSYRGITPEMRVECSGNLKGSKKYMLCVTAVTSPQFVEDFFFSNDGSPLKKPTCYLDDLHELGTWQRIPLVIRNSLNQAVRRVESRERNIAIMNKLRENADKKSLCELADGIPGTAVICTPSPRAGNGHSLGFQIISDGITVKPGPLATDRSKKSVVYEYLLDGKPRHEVFARGRNGLFLNEHLRELASQNETFELGWYIPVAMTKYAAEEMTRQNVIDMIMPIGEGGRNGTYLFRIFVAEKRGERADRDVAYVVTRIDDTFTFVTGLTNFSSAQFVQQGFNFGTPYGLNELKGYVLHVLQKAYCKEMPYNTLPNHLKTGQVKAQGTSHENVS